MRFMVLVKASPESEAGVLPGAAVLAGMGRFDAELVRAGVLLAADRLHPSARGARVRFAGDRRTMVDGPFAGAEGLVAGFSLIQVKTRDEALEWVRRWPPIDAGENVELEIRQLYEREGFGSGAAVERPVQLRDRLARP